MIFGLCYMFHKCRDEGGVVMQKKYLAVKEYLLEQINSGAYQLVIAIVELLLPQRIYHMASPAFLYIVLLMYCFIDLLFC